MRAGPSFIEGQQKAISGIRQHLGPHQQANQSRHTVTNFTLGLKNVLFLGTI